MTKKFPNDKVTCISPWYEIRINPDGSRTYCHAASKQTWEKSELSFIDWFNKGELPTTVRSSISNGIEVADCNRCYESELKGITSYRHRRNIQGAIFGGGYTKEQLVQSPCFPRMNGDVEKIYPAFIHVTLSNLCNLSCRMCFPEFSSQLTQVQKKIGLIQDSIETLRDWTIDEVQWNDFLTLVKDNPILLSVHFMGGEPLYHKKFYDFINWCAENNQTDFHLTFVTNGTRYDPKLIDNLKKFKSVHIELSIENLHQSNDYIRIGSSVNDIKNNILLFLQNKSPDMHIVLRTVPQALSIEHYHTLIDFALENDIPIDSNFLFNPSFLKINILPKELKQNILRDMNSRYNDILSDDFSQTEVTANIRHGLKSVKHNISALISLLEESEPNDVEQLRKKFIEYNIEMDKVSTLKFKDVYPSMFDFYEKYYKM
jgi:sulfatase maturation enzyme AslB (radical SAM superfamily)